MNGRHFSYARAFLKTSSKGSCHRYNSLERLVRQCSEGQSQGLSVVMYSNPCVFSCTKEQYLFVFHLFGFWWCPNPLFRKSLLPLRNSEAVFYVIKWPRVSRRRTLLRAPVLPASFLSAWEEFWKLLQDPPQTYLQGEPVLKGSLSTDREIRSLTGFWLPLGWRRGPHPKYWLGSLGCCWEEDMAVACSVSPRAALTDSFIEAFCID